MCAEQSDSTVLLKMHSAYPYNASCTGKVNDVTNHNFIINFKFKFS